MANPLAPLGMHMHMTFYWGPEVTLLFSSWTTHTWAEYAVALLLTFLGAVAHEALHSYRAKFLGNLRASQRGLALSKGGSVSASSVVPGGGYTAVPESAAAVAAAAGGAAPMLTPGGSGCHSSYGASSTPSTSAVERAEAGHVSSWLEGSPSLLPRGHLRRLPALLDQTVVAVLYGVSTALGYLLMLVAMSFNVGVFAAVVAGHVAGLYAFGLLRLLHPEQHPVTGAADTGCCGS